MIRVTIYKDFEDRERGFLMKGHAGFSDYGTDIVCAAASVLALNTVNSIERLSEDKFQVETDEKKGLLSFRLLENASKESQVLLKSFVIGIESIKEDYGTKYINISYREV